MDPSRHAIEQRKKVVEFLSALIYARMDGHGHGTATVGATVSCTERQQDASPVGEVRANHTAGK